MGSLRELVAPLTGLLERGAVVVFLIMVGTKVWVLYLRSKQRRLDESCDSPQVPTAKGRFEWEPRGKA